MNDFGFSSARRRIAHVSQGKVFSSAMLNLSSLTRLKEYTHSAPAALRAPGTQTQNRGSYHATAAPGQFRETPRYSSTYSA